MKQLHAHTGLMLDPIAFGTYLIPPGEETYRAVSQALEVGYRSIDTAKFYDNEKDVGRAIRNAGLQSEVQVTTKVWIDELPPELAKVAGRRSRDYLGMGSIDLLLVHWPRPELVQTWEAFIELQEEGTVQYIGVSNFEPQHIEKFAEAGLPLPSVNQVELSPVLGQPELRDFCQQKEIIVECWGPLVQGALTKLAAVQDIADKYSITLAQLSLHWAVQRGLRVLPKSVHKERMIENFSIFNYDFTETEMERIDALDIGYRSGPDPADMYHRVFS